MNNKYLLILISAALFPLAGCACKTKFAAPEPLCSSGLTLDEAMRAGEDVLGRLRFPDRKSTRLNSSHIPLTRMPSSA